MTTTLYSNVTSYYSSIARLVLAEKNVKYDLHNLDFQIKLEQFTPEYIKIQPNISLPTLVCDENIVTDSHKILYFVNEHFPGPNLFPKEDAEAIRKSLELHYAFSIEDLTFGTTIRKSIIAKFAMGRTIKRGKMRCLKLMKEHPELKDLLEKKLQLEDERIHLILSKDNNYAQVKQQSIELCDTLETQLSQHQFVASDKYSLADIVWTMFIARLDMIGSDAINNRNNLQAYWQRMQVRKNYISANISTKIPPILIIRMLFAAIFG